MSDSKKTPVIFDTNPPGSNDAIALGCCCPVIDNHYGNGRGGEGSRYGWYVRGDCTIHAENPTPKALRSN